MRIIDVSFNHIVLLKKKRERLYIFLEKVVKHKFCKISLNDNQTYMI